MGRRFLWRWRYEGRGPAPRVIGNKRAGQSMVEEGQRIHSMEKVVGVSEPAVCSCAVARMRFCEVATCTCILARIANDSSFQFCFLSLGSRACCTSTQHVQWKRPSVSLRLSLGTCDTRMQRAQEEAEKSRAQRAQQMHQQVNAGRWLSTPHKRPQPTSDGMTSSCRRLSNRRWLNSRLKVCATHQCELSASASATAEAPCSARCKSVWTRARTPAVVARSGTTTVADRRAWNTIYVDDKWPRPTKPRVS